MSSLLLSLFRGFQLLVGWSPSLHVFLKAFALLPDSSLLPTPLLCFSHVGLIWPLVFPPWQPCTWSTPGLPQCFLSLQPDPWHIVTSFEIFIGWSQVWNYVSYFVDFVVSFLLMFHLRKYFLCQSVPCILACISSTQAFIDVVCCVTFIGESSSLSGLFSQSCRVFYQDIEEWKNNIYAQFALCICVK